MQEGRHGTRNDSDLDTAAEKQVVQPGVAIAVDRRVDDRVVCDELAEEQCIADPLGGFDVLGFEIRVCDYPHLSDRLGLFADQFEDR